MQNYGGFGGGGGTSYYGSARGLPVEDFQDAGTYSLQIDFPEVGRQLDFSYPGDDPSISLSIRDSEARSRNVATLSLIGLLELIFGNTDSLFRNEVSLFRIQRVLNLEELNPECNDSFPQVLLRGRVPCRR